jgi:type I restriction enzyme S subunit
MRQVHRPVETATQEVIPFAGLRWYAGGVYKRDEADPSTVKTSNLNRLLLNDITYNRMWATKGAFGVVGDDTNGCLVTNDFPIFVADKGGILITDFISHVFAQRSFQHAAAALATGTTERRRLKEQAFLSLPILLPPLDEQRRIVDLIAAIDEAIEAATISERAGARLEAALVDEIFAAPDVEPCPLKDFCEPGGIQIGPFGSQLHAADYRPEGIPSIMPRDIVGGVINRGSLERVSEEKAASLDRHRLAEGDILLPRRGDLRKRALVGPAEAGWLCGTGTVRVRPKVTLDPSALYRAISTEAVNGWLSDRAVGATMPNLNTGIVESIPVRLPAEARIPVLVIDGATETSRSAAVEMSSLVSLRSGLLVDLLSGEHEIPASYDELLSA